jgi:hypothetical protein
MPHAHHQDDEFPIPDFEHDPVRTHANTPQPVELALEDSADVRICCPSIDLLDEQPAGAGV